MNRRSLLKIAGLIGAGKVAGEAMVSPGTSQASQPVVLYCDLAVDPAHEQQMLQHFHHDFKPAAEKFEGYIDLKMLKLRTVIQGGPPPPANINYRFQLTYKNEELRLRWVASAAHKKNWPLIENLLVDKGYLVLLTDSV